MTGRAGAGSARRDGRTAALTVAVVLVVAGAAVGPAAAIAPASPFASGETAFQDDNLTTGPENETGERPIGPTVPPETTAGEPVPTGSVPQQGPEADVTVSLEDGEVAAGDAETVTVAVTNDEADEVVDVVVTLQAPDPVLYFGAPSNPRLTRSVYVGELDDGETETFDVDLGTARTVAGTYPLFATVEYFEDGDEDEGPTVGGPTAVGVDVAGEPDLRVEPVTDSVAIDSETTYEVRITNDGERPVTDVVATMRPAPPLSSESPSAYVGTLAPNESATARFALEVSADAVATTDGVEITLSYGTSTDPNERTAVAPRLVPVTITEAEGDGRIDSVVPLLVAGAVIVLAVVWWVRRR